MLPLIGIFVSLGLLIYLAYRGVTVLLLAPALALVAVAFDGDAPMLASYTEVFMKSFGGYVKQYFPLFLLGAVFGKLMAASGSARVISSAISKRIGVRHAILAVVLSCAVLTYGGVSIFVVAFAVYPIAVALFREADVPKRLIPGSIALGSFTFTMTALPGTPQIQNSIPMPFFGTTTFAAPVLGITCGALMFGGGWLWLHRRARAAQARGEGFGLHAEQTEAAGQTEVSALPSVPVAFAPILVVLVANFWLSKSYFPGIDATYLFDKPYESSIEKVAGIWSLVVALTAAILVALAINFKRMKSAVRSLNEGAYSSMLPIINTASEVGYGNVIASLAGFAIIKGAILGVSDNPLISASIATSVLAGVTGSASGGLSIALAALGSTYMEMASQTGLNPEVLHRITSIACGGLDSLPHNGAVITLLGICRLTHRESYADIGMTTVVIPSSVLVVGILLASIGVV